MKEQSLRTLEFPRAAAATSGSTAGAVPKVGTGGAAVTAAAPVIRSIGMLLDCATGEPEASMKLPDAAATASAVVKRMFERRFGEIDCSFVVLSDCMARIKFG